MHFSRLQSSRKFFFILAFVLTGTFTLHSQSGVYIAEDFVNCGVGLKDATGAWVAQPIYTHIYPGSDSYFTVMLGSDRGVIDSQGKTIVPPVYDRVETNYTGTETVFIVEKEKKRGLYNSRGKMVVPVKYKYVLPYSCGKTAVSNNYHKWIFYNYDGSSYEIPFRMSRSPIPVDDSLFIISKSFLGLDWWRLPNRYGMMDSYGRMLIQRKYRDIDYSNEKYNLIRMETKHKVIYANRQLKTVFEGEADKEYTYFQKGDFRSGSYFSNSSLAVNNKGYVLLRINGKWGIMGVNGDTLLPFEYKKIENLNYSSSAKFPAEYYYLVRDSLTGIYDLATRTWVIDPVYSELDVITRYSNEKDSSTVLLFFARTGKNYGVISSSGQVILPFQYPYYRYESNNSWIFYRGDSSVVFCLPQLSSKANSYYRQYTPAVSSIPSDNRFVSRKTTDGTSLFYTPSLINDSAQRSFYFIQEEYESPSPLNYDSLLHATAVVIKPLNTVFRFANGSAIYSMQSSNINISRHTDTSFFYSPNGKISPRMHPATFIASDKNYRYISYNSESYSRRYMRRCGLIRSDGKELARAGSLKYVRDEDQLNGVQIFRITASRSGRDGVLDGNGKLLVDTVWGTIEITENMAVVSKHQRFYWRDEKYNVLDMNTGQLMLTKKQEAYGIYSAGENSFVCSTRKGPTVFSIGQKRFVSDPHFKMIRSLDFDGKYYAVKTCMGNIGLMDCEGKLVVDTVWAAMNFGNYPSQSSACNFYIFHNDASHVIFDAETGKIISENSWRQKLLVAASQNMNLNQRNEIQIRDRYCPTLYLDSGMTLQSIRPWAQEVLTDSLFFPVRFFPDTNRYRKGNTCAYCPKEKFFLYRWSKDYDNNSYAWFISTSGDSCLSASRCQTNYNPKIHLVSPNLFFTTLLYPDGPRPVVLDSLFTGTEWKKMITDEILKYLNETPGITGKCSNPNMFPVMMRRRFQITAEGILLFPPDYYFNNSPVEFLLTWEKLKPYLREDVAGKLGVK